MVHFLRSLARFILNFFYRFWSGGFSLIRQHYLSGFFIHNFLGKYAEKHCFTRHYPKKKIKKNVKLFCSAWGSYLDLYFTYTIPSLLQSKNVPALWQEGYELELAIYTKPEDCERIETQYARELEAFRYYSRVNTYAIDGIVEDTKEARSERMIEGLTRQIEVCLDQDATMLLTTPRAIFGNGSVANAIALTRGKDVCLASAHPRISEESALSDPILEELRLGQCEIANDELVDLVFKYGHYALLHSFDDVDENITRAGISVRKVNEHTYSVIHNLPTVWLANFCEADLRFFREDRTWQNWDRLWLTMLVRSNRVKFVGSSELYFAVEFTTDRDCRIALESGYLYNDKVKDMKLHHFVTNAVCCSWTGTGKVNA
jgi:hypothetical protein